MKRNQSEIRDTLTEIKKNHISNLEYNEAENTQSEKHKEKRIKKNKKSVRRL